MTQGNSNVERARLRIAELVAQLVKDQMAPAHVTPSAWARSKRQYYRTLRRLVTGREVMLSSLIHVVDSLGYEVVINVRRKR